jgi:hypothetical protein
MQAEGPLSPNIIRFSNKDGSSERNFVRQQCTLKLTVEQPRLRINLLGKSEREEIRVFRHQKAYDIALAEGTQPPEEYTATELQAVPSVEVRSSIIRFEGPRLGLIDSSGTRIYDDAITTTIEIGRRIESEIRHYSPTNETDDGHAYISLLLPVEEMAALREALVQQPNAALSLRIVLQAFPEKGFFQPVIYIAPDQPTRITDFSISVAEPEASSAIEWDRERESWVQEYRGRLTKDDIRLADAVECCAAGVASYFAREGRNAKASRFGFSQAENLVEKIDSELRLWSRSPFKEDKDRLWRHINFAEFLRKTTVEQREEFFELTESLDQYISNSHLQNDYMDWVILDILVAHKITTLFDSYMRLKHGMAYAFAGAVWWRLLLAKLVIVPLSVLINWILPGVGFFYIAKASLWLGVALATAYYGYSLFLLTRWLWSNVLGIVFGEPSPARRLRSQIEEAERVYVLLAGPVIYAGAVQAAAGRAAEKGVLWNPALFYVLDASQERCPKPWRNTVWRSPELREALQNVAAD